RMRSPCCACATLGHAAAPPIRVMNSRRLMCSPLTRVLSLPHRSRRSRLVHHSKFGGQCLRMGWSGRAPALPASQTGRPPKTKEHAMSQILNSKIDVIGIDIGKNSFHVVGQDERGAIVLRQKWSRGQMEARLATLPRCLIGMEACTGAHHLSRKLQALGRDARLMPAKYVRPYSKGQKNDFRDAEAIAEAVQRPTMKFVATKTAEQLDLQALHR